MANIGYGQGAYGVRRYGGWPGGLGRPYGIGGYGTGPYARYGANLYEAGGRTGLRFLPTMELPRLRMQFAAQASITFLPWISGFARVFHPEAVTQIVFSVHAEGVLAWADTAPCMTGAWTQVMCGTGAWEALEGCSVGAWAGTELVR